MASPYRIVVADPSPKVPRLVQTALDVLGRQAILVAVTSGEDALAELGRGGVTALVASYNLDDMYGFELGMRASAADSNTAVIILAGPDAPEMDAETQAQSPYHYLRVDQHGPQFASILRQALDGGPISLDSGAVVAAAPAAPVMPVPQVELATGDVNDFLFEVLHEAGAMSVLLMDRLGATLAEVGATGELDRDFMANAFVHSLADLIVLGEFVGGEPRSLLFCDGDKYDLFVLSVGYHHFICLVFEGSSGSRAFGAVNRYGRSNADKILEMIGDVAYSIPKTAAPAPAPAARSESAAARSAAAAAPPPPAPAAPAPAEAYEPPPPQQLEPLPDDADLEAVLMGLGSVDQSAMDALFNPDTLAEIAAEQRSGERLTFEEAQQLGVLPDNP